MGDPVNIAFRIMELATAPAKNDILASASVIEGLEGDVAVSVPFERELTAIPKPVILYEVNS